MTPFAPPPLVVGPRSRRELSQDFEPPPQHPPLNGERHPQSFSGRVMLPPTSSSPSRSCRSRPRPPKFSGAPLPLKNSIAPPHLRPPPWTARSGDSRRPSDCPTPPSHRIGGHREDRTAFQPTPRRRSARHHPGRGHGDCAEHARAIGMGWLSHFSCWAEPVASCLGPNFSPTLFIGLFVSLIRFPFKISMKFV
jgi:hypothetical protein